MASNRHWNLRQAQDIARLNAEHADHEPEAPKASGRKVLIRRRSGHDTRIEEGPSPEDAPREVTAADRARVREELRRAS